MTSSERKIVALLVEARQKNYVGKPGLGHRRDNIVPAIVVGVARVRVSRFETEFWRIRLLALHFPANALQAARFLLSRIYKENRMSAGKSVFEFENLGDVLIVVPTGSLAEFRDNDIRDAYNETYRLLSEPNVKHLLVDFSSLTYFGSTFIGMLIRLAKKARQGGGQAVLCNLSDNMKGMMKTLMLLENTKTDFFWTPFKDRPSAMASLAASTESPATTSVEAPTESPDNPEESGGGGWARFTKD